MLKCWRINSEIDFELTMENAINSMNHRDSQIICGLFLSKFDQSGLEYLGFDSFTEAFNALAYGLGARPASIKNYRDELDPYFPNARHGWHKRPLRDHCRRILAAYKDADVDQMGEMIKGFLIPASGAASIPEVRRILSLHDADADSSFAKRLITGRSAEQYFAGNYSDMAEFSGLELTNTTGWGCGFDFKLSQPGGDAFCAVEVKGLRTKSGQIQMTELEHDMAHELRDRYYLVLVRNFIERPYHTVINDPLNCEIQFTKVERQEVRMAWTASVGE